MVTRTRITCGDGCDSNIDVLRLYPAWYLRRCRELSATGALSFVFMSTTLYDVSVSRFQCKARGKYMRSPNSAVCRYFTRCRQISEITIPFLRRIVGQFTRQNRQYGTKSRPKYPVLCLDRPPIGSPSFFTCSMSARLCSPKKDPTLEIFES